MSGCAEPRLPRDSTVAAADTDCWQALKPGFHEMYGAVFCETVQAAFIAASDCQRVYIVGCLLLNLTASVNPALTRYSRRFSRNLRSHVATAAASAAAGLYTVDDAINEATAAANSVSSSVRLRCFHCNALVSSEIISNDRNDEQQISGKQLLDSDCDNPDEFYWSMHRAASPACYYVRLRDFIVQHLRRPIADQPQQPQLSVNLDIEKFLRALRKLRRDLAELTSLRLAADFGYAPRVVAFCATRHFMRHGGRTPERAGEMIACLHTCQDQFEAAVLESVDVSTVLKVLSPLLLIARHPSVPNPQ
uniref:Ligand-binding domain of nuclear hormone receptor n=1 Tax=Macrostomum lignano TaxID=282301 RepID=A0A1I8I0Z7_9PLAT